MLQAQRAWMQRASCGHLLLCCTVQTDGKLRSEIVAHSRWLSAMDIHPKEDIIVTAAEDATVNVWQLPIGGNKVGCKLVSTPTTTADHTPYVTVQRMNMHGMYKDCATAASKTEGAGSHTLLSF